MNFNNKGSVSFIKAQVLWGMFVISVILFIYLGETEFTGEGPLNQWHILMTTFAVYSVAGPYFARRKLKTLADEAVRAGNIEKGAKMQLGTQIFGFASGESIVLCGFVAKCILGSPRWYSTALYVFGFLLLLAYRPSRSSFIPVSTDSVQLG